MAENRGLAGYSADGTATSETLFTPAWFNSLSSHLARIREDKFLPLFPQLLVRLTTTSSTPKSGSKTQAAFKGMLEGVRSKNRCLFISTFRKCYQLEVSSLFHILV